MRFSENTFESTFTQWLLCGAVMCFSLAIHAENTYNKEFEPGSVNPALRDTNVRPSGSTIIDKVGSTPPLDATFTSHDGSQFTLNELVKSSESIPTIISLGYYTCPMLCSLVINSTFDSLALSGLKPIEDYRFVFLSIDPKEDVELASKKYAGYYKKYFSKFESNKTNIIFGVGREQDVKSLADGLGFGYVWDEKSEQYAHAAGIFLLSPETGRLSRTLWGLNYEGADMRRALVEASEGKIGTVVDKILISCFRYDADSHKYGFYIFGAFKLVGVFTIIFIAGILFWLWRSEKRNRAVT